MMILRVGIAGVNSFKPEYCRHFEKFNVILALDNDTAGESKYKTIAELFGKHGQKIRRLDWKPILDAVGPCKDITEYYMKRGNKT